MARAINPLPNKADPMWKMYFDAVDEYHRLVKIQKNIDEEEKAFQQSLKSSDVESNDNNVEMGTSTQVPVQEEKND